MPNFQPSSRGRQASFVTALLLLVGLLLAACGDSTATTAPAPTAVVATSAPTTAPAPTTDAATSTPVVIATARPTTASAPTTTIAATSAATNAPASTAATSAPTSAPAPTTSAPLFGTGATTTAVAATPTALATKVTQGQILSFDADGAYKHVKTLAGDIGIRAAGSENQKKAGDYIAKQFESFGLKSQFQESRYGWQRDTGSLLTVGGETPVKLRLQLVSTTAQRQTQADLVYLDTSAADDLKLENKVVLLDENNLNNNAFVQKIVKGQPLAILIIPTQPDPLMSPTLRAGTLSLAYIEQAAGKQLAQRATQTNLSVKLNFNWEKADIAVRNVIGTRPAAGNALDAPIIIIGGHYDSVPEGPGANDNGSGTATVIELARVLAKAYPEVEFRFVGFDAEELGLIGSRDYVSKLSAAEKSRIQAMINIDMIAVGQKLSVSGKKNLAGIAKGVGLDLGLRDVEVSAVERSGGSSDHASFDQAGIPFLSFGRSSDPNYHRPGDMPDKFTKEPLDKVAQITLGTLQRFLLTQS